MLMPMRTQWRIWSLKVSYCYIDELIALHFTSKCKCGFQINILVRKHKPDKIRNAARKHSFSNYIHLIWSVACQSQRICYQEVILKVIPGSTAALTSLGWVSQPWWTWQWRRVRLSTCLATWSSSGPTAWPGWGPATPPSSASTRTSSARTAGSG